MTNESLLILGLLTPLFAAFGSYCFKNNINVRDSFGVIGGIITFLISLKIFNGLQAEKFGIIVIHLEIRRVHTFSEDFKVPLCASSKLENH